MARQPTTRVLAGAVLLGLAAPAMAQVCTTDSWNADIRDTRTVDGMQYCIDYARTPLLPENALWQFQCPYLDLGTTADIGSTAMTGALLWSLDGSGSNSAGPVDEHAAAVESPAGCAEVCRRQAFGDSGETAATHRLYLAPSAQGGTPAPCVAFLYEPGSQCALLKSVNSTALSPNPGAQYYQRASTGASRSVMPVGVTTEGPGTCGCPSNAVFADRCVVGCEDDAICVQVDISGTFNEPEVFVKDPLGVGACRGRTPTDRADDDLTMAYRDSPAGCLELCTGADCYGVTVMAPETSSSGACETTVVAACAGAAADQAACEAAGACTFISGVGGAANTCTTTDVAACAAGTASGSDCTGAGACTFTSTDQYTCEIWNKVNVIAGGRRNTKILASELNPGERHEAIRPLVQSGVSASQNGHAQCWIPKHASQVCIIGASSSNTNDAVTSAALTNGVVMEHCEATDLVVLGPQTCIECNAAYGPDPTTTDAVCNPRYMTPRADWFQAGNLQCKQECADNPDLLTECAGWTTNDECNTNEAYMRLNCAFSCTTWLKPNAHCIEPEDPFEAILRCTPCPSTYHQGYEYASLCFGGSVLSKTQCTDYAVSEVESIGFGQASHVARVFVENQGWRDIPLGHEVRFTDGTVDPDFNRCEEVKAGPNFGALGVPVPPNSLSLKDRYKVSCVKQTRECSSYHRSTRGASSGCGQDYFSLRLDYYIDCVAGFAGCKETENYVKVDDPSKKWCNRGLSEPAAPPHGYRWDIPICKVTPECIEQGAAVLVAGDGEAEDMELFRRDCCTFDSVDDVPAGPDGFSDLRELCSDATSGAGRAGPVLRLGGWLALAWAAAATQW